MTGRLRAHRLVVGVSVAVVALVGVGGAWLAAAGASGPASSDALLGPGPVTVTLRIDHSHFETAPIRVRPHTEVRFVVINRDPIGHELIVGGPEVQARHEHGREAHHPSVSGEVSVPAEGRASTTYVFHAPGPVEYACHLPGHYRYGMHGFVEVVAGRRGR